MYVIDTNTFYYACEFSEFTYDLEKLKSFIRDNDIIISSTSLFEFFVRYKDDIDTIRKGSKYLWENHIKILFNIFNPMPEHFIDDIVNISETQYQLMLSEIINNKIDVESRFTTLIFDACLFSGYYFTAMSDGKEPCKYCFGALDAIYKLFTNCVNDVFRSMYTDGYKTNDCENYIRNSFYNLLSFMLEKGIPFIENAKNVTTDVEFTNPDIWFTIDEYHQLSKQLSLQLGKKTSTAFLHQKAVTYWKKNNDPQLKQYIQKIKGMFDKRIQYEALQDYFYDSLANIMVSGAALRKNDFLDALIMCNMQDQHQLVTYDGGVIKRMEKRRNQYKKYDESLKTIDILKS